VTQSLVSYLSVPSCIRITYFLEDSGLFQLSAIIDYVPLGFSVKIVFLCYRRFSKKVLGVNVSEKILPPFDSKVRYGFSYSVRVIKIFLEPRPLVLGGNLKNDSHNFIVL
jgi:hypothetical protein